MRRHLAPIELLHPMGAPRGTAVIRPGVPDWIVPLDAAPEGAADVVLLDAGAEPFNRVARDSVARLSEVGLVVATGTGRRRQELGRSLAAHGLAAEVRAVARRGRRTADAAGLTIVVPDGTRTRLDPRWETLPFTVFSRLGAGPLGAWLPGAGGMVVRTSWRGPVESATVARLERDGKPVLYAKVGLGWSTADVGAREARALGQLGPAASRAGARVPVVRSIEMVADRPVALLSRLDGRPLAEASRRSVERRRGTIVGWLVRFAEATRSTAPAAPLIDEVLRLADDLVRGIDGGTAYLELLHRLADEVGDATTPATAAHGDLTVSNILDGERPGIVDWEAARTIAWPLIDLPYLLVDLRLATTRGQARVQAFESCFPRSTMTGNVQALSTSLELPRPVLELAFHSCWLGHAANEHARGRRGPFSEIVAILARRASA